MEYKDFYNPVALARKKNESKVEVEKKKESYENGGERKEIEGDKEGGVEESEEGEKKKMEGNRREDERGGGAIESQENEAEIKKDKPGLYLWGTNPPKILNDLTEALVGAIHADSG